MANNIRRLASGFLALALMLAWAIVPVSGAVWANGPTSCQGIDNCEVVNSDEELYAFFTVEYDSVANKNWYYRNGAATLIFGSDFTLAHDYYIKEANLDIYFNNNNVTANDYSLLFYGSTVDFYGPGTLTNAAGYYSPIYIRDNSSVTINDIMVSGGQSLVGSDEPEPGVIVDDTGSLMLESGTITAKTWGVSVWEDSSFVMNGGVVEATGEGSIGVAGNGSTTGATITMNGGTINSGELGIYAPQMQGVTTINGGVINALAGVEVRAGALNIHGGTINVPANTAYTISANGNGSTTTGAAVAVAQHTTLQPINVNITGGVFTAPIAFVEANPQYNDAQDIQKVSLSISGGSFNATNGDPVVASEDVTGFITGGVYNKSIEDSYVASGSFAYYDGYDDTYTVATAPAVTGFAANYDVRAGQQLVFDYALTPEISGNWIDVYSVNSLADLCGESELATNCFDFDDSTRTLSVDPATTLGAHNMEYVLADGTTGNFTVTVLPRGSVTMESKTVYAPMYDEITWEELGVIVDGEGYDATVTGEGDASVNVDDKTVYLYSDNTAVTWTYEGNPVGTIIFKGYDLGRFYSDAYIRVGGAEEYYESNINEELNYTIADESIAKFEGPFERESSDDYTYKVWEIRGLKAGETKLVVTPKDNTEIISRDNGVVVFDLESDIKAAQQIGTSQTFSLIPQAGYRIREVYGGESSSEDEEPAVKLTSNEDGTYTLTVSRIPCFKIPAGEEDEEPHEEEYCQNKTFVSAILEKEDSGEEFSWISATYEITLYDFAAKDEATEEVEGEEKTAEQNEEILSSYTAEILETIFGDEELMATEEEVYIQLSDGKTIAVIDDVAGLVAAIQNGDQVTATLTAPEEIKEEDVDADEKKGLTDELGKVAKDAKGMKFVNVEVKLSVGDDTYGRITELKDPMSLIFDVAGETPVANGYTRKWWVVRYHDGVATVLDAEYDPENEVVATASDKFSTYLIAYTDTKDESSSTTTPEETSESEPSESSSASTSTSESVSVSTSESVIAYETVTTGEAEEEATDSEKSNTSSTTKTDDKKNDKATTNGTSEKEEDAPAVPVLGIILGVAAVIAIIAFIVAMSKSKER